jgi:uncharacterized protein (DUF1786 family)
MSTKKPRARTARRASEREARKLADDLERLARMERGGAPDRPIEVASASQVDVHARDARCPVCTGLVRLEDHTAETIGGVRLRVAHVRCGQCGRKRAIYFRLVSTAPN